MHDECKMFLLRILAIEIPTNLYCFNCEFRQNIRISFKMCFPVVCTLISVLTIVLQAFLEHGVPETPEMVVALMQKVGTEQCESWRIQFLVPGYHCTFGFWKCTDLNVFNEIL